MRSLNYILGAALLAACTAEPQYELPSQQAPAALLVSKTGLTAFARFAMVDGKETPLLGGELRVAPGPHKVHVQCYHFETKVGPGFMLALPRGVLLPITLNSETKQGWFSVAGHFASDQSYYARCVMVDEKPVGFISATPDGPPLPGFD